jgi:hypothetical protein
MQRGSRGEDAYAFYGTNSFRNRYALKWCKHGRQITTHDEAAQLDFIRMGINSPCEPSRTTAARNP